MGAYPMMTVQMPKCTVERADAGRPYSSDQAALGQRASVRKLWHLEMSVLTRNACHVVHDCASLLVSPSDEQDCCKGSAAAPWLPAVVVT